MFTASFNIKHSMSFLFSNEISTVSFDNSNHFFYITNILSVLKKIDIIF